MRAQDVMGTKAGGSARPAHIGTEAVPRRAATGKSDVLRSIDTALANGKFVSINYLNSPGFTDTPAEAEALLAFLEDHPIHMIQWRNLNMDPDAYLEVLGQKLPAGIGIARLIDEMPVRRGYFNPYLGEQRSGGEE